MLKAATKPITWLLNIAWNAFAAFQWFIGLQNVGADTNNTIKILSDWSSKMPDITFVHWSVIALALFSGLIFIYCSDKRSQTSINNSANDKGAMTSENHIEKGQDNVITEGKKNRIGGGKRNRIGRQGS